MHERPEEVHQAAGVRAVWGGAQSERELPAQGSEGATQQREGGEHKEDAPAAQERGEQAASPGAASGGSGKIGLAQGAPEEGTRSKTL